MFSHWMDGTIVLQAFWDTRNNPAGRSNLTVHNISNGGIISSEYTYSEAMDQPEHNMKKNCTASLLDHTSVVLMWIVLPCDEKFEVTFFCVPRGFASANVVTSTLHTPSKQTCEDNWILIKDHNKCYLPLMASRALSFNEGNTVCSKWNSTLLNIQTSSRPTVPMKAEFQIKDMFQNAYKHINHANPPQHYYNNIVLSNFLFGLPLDFNLISTGLPYIMYLAFRKEPSSLIFLASIDGKCGTLEYNKAGMYLQKYFPKELATAWGAKLRPCDLKMVTNEIICERKSEIYVPYCKSIYFGCIIRSCILLVYVCDGIEDCLDGSDERHCSSKHVQENADFKFESQYVRIPSLLISNINITDINELQDLRIHSICDGINVDGFSLIDDTCPKPTVKPIVFNVLQINKHFLHNDKGTFKTRNLIDMYEKEISYSQKTTPNIKNETIDFLHYTFRCSDSGSIFLYERCLLNRRSELCDFPINPYYLCRNILCPGMFKCSKYVCLPMSAICDGHTDCLYGEDEHSCSNLSCPGLLKCRGELKCVSDQEICDGEVNCLYSSDDEINCTPCPEGCECLGYSTVCVVKHIWNDPSTYYAKGLTLTGIQNVIDMNVFLFPKLIVLKLSQCKIEKFIRLQSSNLSNALYHIIIADFSKNYIRSNTLLQHPVFLKLTYINLSNNLITFFLDNNLLLKYMVVLNVKHNPINALSVDIHNRLRRLSMIDITYVNFSISLEINIMSNRDTKLQVSVSDSSICCLLPSYITCNNPDSNYMCHGLLNKSTIKWSFYAASIISLFWCVCLVTSHTFKLSAGISKKKYYMISRFNQVSADVFSSSYLVCIMAADTLDINTVKWRTSYSCICLRFVFFVSLQTSFVFKVMSIAIIAAKICFPFKHQCRWLKLTGIICGVAWVITVSIYFSLAELKTFKNSRMSYDVLCTCFECHDGVFSDLISIISSFIDIVLISCFCAAATFSFRSIKHTSLNSGLNGHKKKSAVEITFKLGRIIYSDIAFRICLFSILFTKVVHHHYDENYCLSTVMYILPLNLIISCMLAIFVS